MAVTRYPEELRLRLPRGKPEALRAYRSAMGRRVSTPTLTQRWESQSEESREALHAIAAVDQSVACQRRWQCQCAPARKFIAKAPCQWWRPGQDGSIMLR